MHCCQCVGIEETFTRKTAKRELKRYRKKGPNKTTRLLIDALEKKNIQGMTLLDIGGGVGAIQHELLKAGITHTVDVDASSSYLEAAKEEGQRQGSFDRMKFYFGDFVNLAPNIAEADIVTLDRVICCYDEVEKLLRFSSVRARKFYGVVYPRLTLFVKMGVTFGNFLLWLGRSQFRIFLHPTETVDRIIRSHGLKKISYGQTLLWQVVIYGR
jgi:magnesium-protoporphyrin O-methyltransferase